MSSILVKLAEVLVRILDKKTTPPPWRWGHSFLPADNQCIYCHQFIPGRVQHTPTPCSGPDHKLSKKELGR